MHRSLGDATLVAFLAAALASLSNLLFNVLGARALGPAGYGLLASLFVVMGTYGVAASGLQAATAREAATGDLNHDGPFLDPWTRRVAFQSSWMMLALVLLAIPLGWVLAASPAVTCVVALFAMPAAVMFVGFGRLIGKGKLITWQILSLLSIVTKLGVGAAAFALGAGVFGFALSAPIGLGVAAVLAILLSRGVHIDSLRLRQRAVWGSSVVLLLIWATTQIDVLIGRAVLPAILSGEYAAAAVIGKASPIVVGVIGTIALPTMARKLHSGGTGQRIGFLVGGASLVISSLIALVLTLVGPAILLTLYGPEYLGSSRLLVPIVWAAVPWCVAVGVINLKLAGHHFQVLTLSLGVVLVIETLLLILTSGNVLAYIASTAIAGILAAVAALVIRVRPANIQQSDTKEATSASFVTFE